MFATVILSTLISTFQPPHVNGEIQPELRTTGDNPPTAYLSFEGQYDLASALIGLNGAFVLDGIPAGATVVKALVITGAWTDAGAPFHTIDFELAGTDYGTIPALIVDLDDTTFDLDLGAYVIDVSQQVLGNGTYQPIFTLNQSGTGPWASLLWVIYTRPDLPLREILLNVGAESLVNSSSTSDFTVASEGNGTLHLFTEADQAEFSAGTESVDINGQEIACCDVFAGALSYGSYLQYPVTVVAGVNTVTVTTGEDWFGWHVGALVVLVGPTAVSEDSWSRIKAKYR